MKTCYHLDYAFLVTEICRLSWFVLSQI